MTESNGDTRVLVTGATGFVAGHCIKALLERGFRVRGTVRNLADEKKNRHLRTLETRGQRVELVEADLDHDQGWAEAVSDCRFVLHVASPFPAEAPDDENDLIRPAVEGTRRLLEACAGTGGAVKRVVLTSSTAAVQAGHPDRGERAFTEDDWSILDRCEPYEKSKTLAERAAWDFVSGLSEERRFELSVINPGFVAGPLMSDIGGTSAEIVRRLMAREMPACPRLGWAMVDVRDIAEAHLLAMLDSEAAGNRYVCAGEHIWLQDMAKILDQEFRPRGFRVPTGHLPYALLWLAARFDRRLRSTLSAVGRRERVSADKAMRELGWKPRSYRETLVDMGQSAINLGIVSAR